MRTLTNMLAAPVVGGCLIAAACATKSGTGATVGAAGGAAIGGVVGGTEGALIGAALGGLAGYGVGRAMEEEDRRRVAYALERNERMRWENPETGYQYEVVPQRTVFEQGRECREFRMLAEVERRPEEIYGTACRQPDGSWQMLSG